MKKLQNILLIAFLCLACYGCIKNDIPYPRIQANFLTFEAATAETTGTIDSTNRVVTLLFPEESNLASVEVTEYTLTEGAEVLDNPFGSPVDLTEPLFVTLRLYQDYIWKIVADQPIERYFEIEGQMGTSVIDVPAHRVVCQVSTSMDLSSLTVVRAKLGAIGSTYSPSLAEGTHIDGREPFSVTVTTHGVEQEWVIYIEAIAPDVKTVSAEPWTCVAWVSGEGEAGGDNGVEYRLAGDEEWTRVPAEDVTHNGGNFMACIKHLSPMTTYEARAVAPTSIGDVLTFTTGSVAQMPNSDFEYWWLDKKVWCPWAQDGTPYWGTGNKGAATMGDSNTTPSEDTPTGTGLSAKLESRFVGLGPIGKLAAGNIFVGEYVRTDGTNGILGFGRPFTNRPTKLKGYYKCDPKTIDRTSDEYKNRAGQPDTCIIWCALVDLDEPLEIRTNPKDRQLFDPNASYVVAYGRMVQYQAVPDWIPFEFELNYTSITRKPKYILVTASASSLGDYFTGGSGSTLWIDDLVLDYDY